MIVQCPSCESRYRIREENIPASGGKIRCPSCGHGFVVYPESAKAPEVDDRTSVTSRDQMEGILGQMKSGGIPGFGGAEEPSEAEDDYQATQIHTGDLDQMRAELAAQAEEDPFGNDGTVEIQNPMAMWADAQEAVEASKARAAAAREQQAAMESSLLESSDPTNLMNPMPDDVPELDPQTAAQLFGGGPPQPPGRPSGPPPQPSNGFARGPSASGLHSAQLFEESEGTDPFGATAGMPAAGGPGMGGPPPGGPGMGGPSPGGPGMGGPPPGGPAPAGGGPNPDHPGPWKLKTSIGLTYEFADTKSLRNWMSGREELDGYELSQGDNNFFPLDQYPQLSRSAGRPMQPSGNFSMPSQGSGLNPQPPNLAAGRPPSGRHPAHESGLNPPSMSTQVPRNATERGPRVSNEFRPPSRNSKAGLIMWPIFILLLLIFIPLALHTFKVVDLEKLILQDILGQAPDTPTTPTNPTPAANAQGEAAPDLDPTDLAKQQRLEADRLIKDAERLIEGNKLPAARDKLESTQSLVPNDPVVYEMLADVHSRLGNADEATKAEEKAKELRAAMPAEAPDAGTTD